MCIDIKGHPIAFEMKQKINIEKNALRPILFETAKKELLKSCFKKIVKRGSEMEELLYLL